MQGNTNSTPKFTATKTRLGQIWSWEDENGFHDWTINPMEVQEETTINPDGSETLELTTMNYTSQTNPDGSETIIIGGIN
jgi:hypothetical protein